MSTNSGSNMQLSALHGVIWPLEFQPDLEQQIAAYNGRDNHLGIVWLENKRATLRIYDEFTIGGRLLVAEPFRVAPDLPGVLVGVGDPMPTDLPQPTPAPEYVFIDVETGAATIDLSTWLPTGLLINQRVQVRKVDTNPGRISYLCPHRGINYVFVDKQGEFITLLWCGASFHII